MERKPNGFHDEIYAFFDFIRYPSFSARSHIHFPTDLHLHGSKREGLNAFHPDEQEERKWDSFLRLVYMKWQLVKTSTVFNFSGIEFREVLGSLGCLRLRYSV